MINMMPQLGHSSKYDLNWPGVAGGDGYDFLDAATARGWVAVSAWGKDGWDAGSWPYQIFFVKRNEPQWHILSYTEGDLTHEVYGSKIDAYLALEEWIHSLWKFEHPNWDLTDPKFHGPYGEKGQAFYATEVKEVKKQRISKLIAALRSGQYKQTTGVLRNEDKFCCLGVACDLSGLAEWKPISESITFAYSYMNATAGLPYEVQNWYGLPGQFGFIPTKYMVNPDRSSALDSALYTAGLAGLNDMYVPFEEIADIIETWAEEEGMLPQ